jgi:predicted PurR-regulated permease PerM
MPVAKNPSMAALSGIWNILIAVAAVAILYVGKTVLIPLTLAGLLTFLLAPIVRRLERWIGRIASVLIIVAILFVITAGAGWLLTQQLIALSARVPEFQANIENRVKAVRIPPKLTRFTRSWEHLRRQLPGASAPVANGDGSAPANESSSNPPDTTAQRPMPVEIVGSENDIPHLLQTVVGGILGPIGTAGLVLLLVIFMLLKREDLRGRFIRLIGQGRISETTHAMDDAGRRVARYLSMQFLVNMSYGVLVGLGLYFIGLPGAMLWGVFAGIMRFIPYIGPWIGAIVPMLLSIAVSNNWLTPGLTIGLFVLLELGNANVLEPWLYGTSTGVSPFALIIAAVFWTWLWGPMGLLLSTPLTVCLSVMGRHVPKLEPLGVLLSEEEALAPHEECYHRLLALRSDEATKLAESFLKSDSLAALYDQMLLPIIKALEMDVRRGAVDPEERETVQQGLIELIEDLETVPAANQNGSASPDKPAQASRPCRVFSLPVRAYRDELAATMLTHLLRHQHFQAENAPSNLNGSELDEMITKFYPDVLCISVVAPSTLVQARSVTAKMRALFPLTKIIVGKWGATDIGEALPRLQASGADELVSSFADALEQISKLSCGPGDAMMPAAIPDNDEERLRELHALNVLDSPPEEAFDNITRKVARVLQVPIALITLVDRDRQWFKSQVGLPEDLAKSRYAPRESSVCGHVVADGESIVVEDIARDRRFANNPFLLESELRFYAGVPLRVNDLPVGSLCVLDIKPRKLSQTEQRFLETMAEEVVEQLALRLAIGDSPSAA